MSTSVTSLRNPIDDLTARLKEQPAKPIGTLEEEFGAMASRGARAREIAPEITQQALKKEEETIIH